MAHWARNATDAQPCFSQWRGSNQEYRAEIWGHIGHLFKALSALHESRIVHRRIQPENLFIDESTSRDQPGFIKLGRFEASTFFNAVRRTEGEPADVLSIDQRWYHPTLPNYQGRVIAGTPAGDIYSMLITIVWLLTARPNNKQDMIRFREKLVQGTGADSIRRFILTEAIAMLPQQAERRFFRQLLKPRFPSTALASDYQLRAKAVESIFRGEKGDSGPLCIVVSTTTIDELTRLLTSNGCSASWDEWLPKQLADARLAIGTCDVEKGVWQCRILLPNGWQLLCAVFRTPSGASDWKRLSVNRVLEFPWNERSKKSIQLRHVELRVNSTKTPPPSARSWRGIFDELVSPQESVDPAVEALDYLNLAELAFWEEHVVPVRVEESTVTWKNDIGTEKVVIRQLEGQADMPHNRLIRRRQIPDFSVILREKSEVRVELSNDQRLWDRQNGRTVWVSADFEVRDVPQCGSGQHELTLYREGLARADARTPCGLTAWFKTQDQAWQMGLFRRRKDALSELERHAILSEVLRNPRARHRCIDPVPLSLDYANWSEEKSQLVSRTMATAPLFLVQGPPGTGKSTYVAGLMQHILSAEEDPQARILVAAHMHFAIDHLASRVKERFATSIGEQPPIILRLTSADRAKTRQQMRDQARQLFEPCCRTLRTRGSDPIYLAIADSITSELDSELTDESVLLLAEAASIILTTCADACLEGFSAGCFDWVIIEEAGRVVGCDLSIPMRLGHRWVLIGDPNQLGPYRKEDFRSVVDDLVRDSVNDGEIDVHDQTRITSNCEHLLGPFETFFDEIPTSAKEMLSEQHRMHPDICRVVSHAFYDDKLVDAPSVDRSYLFGDDHAEFGGRAVVWIDVPHLHWPNGRSTEDEIERDGFSFQNEVELEVTEQVLLRLTRTWPQAQSKSDTRVLKLATISPYRRQVSRLGSLLRKIDLPAGLGLCERAAATATAFQGQEADIAILNLVRNNTGFEMGFLDAPQMNVALSRARKLMIIIGCFAMLKQKAESNAPELQFCKRLVQVLAPSVIPAATFIPGVNQ
ncbi:MAG: AAA family ATPase [Planctomycetaceae bacterium]|nr:AAA family ATPase [Planctomycetaceae bacterium]